MRNSILSSLLFAGLLAASTACAQAVDGTLDLAWGNGSQQVVPFDLGANQFDLGRAIVVDPQGRAIVAGTVATSAATRVGLVRFLPDGSLDPSYGPDNTGRSVVPSAGTSIEANAAVAEGDGHVVIAGARVTSGSDTAMILCHVQANGGLGAFEGNSFACAELEFNLGGTLRDVANSIIMQADGKYVVAGSAATADGNQLAVARFHHDGTLDTSFGTGGKTTFLPAAYRSFVANRILQLPDGSFGIAGAAILYGELEFGFLAHLDADGILDEDFAGGGFERSPNPKTRYTDLGWNASSSQYVVIGTRSFNNGGVGTVKCHLANGPAVVCPGGDHINPEFDLGYDTQFNAMLRERDGRWLVAGTRRVTDSASADAFVARIDQAMHLDTIEFAAPAGFLAHDFGLPGLSDVGLAITLAGPRVLVAGYSVASTNPPNLDYSVFAVGMDGIFRNGFDK